MKRIVFLISLIVPLLLATLGTTSPLKGRRSLEKRIDRLDAYPFREKFRGGERACVIVKGDHKPVVNLEVYVYDDKDQLVAVDKGGGDFVAVIWYPPRDAEYKIKIHNPGKEYNDCYISLK